MIRTSRNALERTKRVCVDDHRLAMEIQSYLSPVSIQYESSNVIGMASQFHQQCTRSWVVDAYLVESRTASILAKRLSTYHILRRTTGQDGARWIHCQAVDGMFITGECGR